MRRGPAYCRGPLKRGLDIAISLVALLILAPVLLLLALLVLVSSGWPALFVQERIGRDGRPFKLVKFRTMRGGGAPGLPLTGRGDPRITRLGRYLRVAKLDELPQLVNVLRGDMSLVRTHRWPHYARRGGAVKRQVCRNVYR